MYMYTFITHSKHSSLRINIESRGFMLLKSVNKGHFGACTYMYFYPLSDCPFLGGWSRIIMKKKQFAGNKLVSCKEVISIVPSSHSQTVINWGLHCISIILTCTYRHCLVSTCPRWGTWMHLVRCHDWRPLVAYC